MKDRLRYYLCRTTQFSIASVAVLVTACNGQVFALTGPQGMSNLDFEAIVNDWENWVPNTCNQSGGGSLSGSDNAQKVFDYFTSKGYRPEWAAGIVGNTSAESGNLPERLEGTSASTITPYASLGSQQNARIGWGLTQWTPPNKIGNYVSRTGENPDDLSTQAEFLWKQLEGTAPNNGEKPAGDAVKQTTTAGDAALAFMNFYERPADPAKTGPVRVALANAALKLYGGSAPTGGGGGVSGSCNGGGGGGNSSCVTTVGTGKFTDSNTTQLPGWQTACARAHQFASTRDCGVPGPTDGCQANECDHAAGYIWSYANSGYDSAQAHWDTLKAQGQAHPGDRNPPVGALLFYNNGGPFGHVVVYLGNNMIASSDWSSINGYKQIDGSIGIVPASYMESGPWKLSYYGWTDPIFRGSHI